MHNHITAMLPVLLTQPKIIQQTNMTLTQKHYPLVGQALTPLLLSNKSQPTAPLHSTVTVLHM